MNTRSLLPLTVLLLASLVAIVPNAEASLYRSTNGTTELRLAEWDVPPANRTGTYTTKIGNQIWKGTIKISVANSGMGSVSYEGTFEDSPVDNLKIKCQGILDMTRTPIGRSATMKMGMNWAVTGGSQCPAIGKEFTLSLPEALPIANAKGDYSQAWGRWKMVSPDGSLNCRATPNGKIVHTFTRADEFLMSMSEGNPFTPLNGNAWMRVAYPKPNSTSFCHVRANAQFISPMSLGF